MALLASPFVDWSALLKIVLAALLGGAGVVILFGILLLGVKHARRADEPRRRAGAYAVSGICGVICVGAVAVGIYAMAHKPSSKPAPAPSKGSTVTVLAPKGSG
jgi:ammonia channel protein AmtB